MKVRPILRPLLAATMVKGLPLPPLFKLFNGVLYDVSSGGMVTVLAVLSGFHMVIGNTLGAIQDKSSNGARVFKHGHAGFMMLATYASVLN